MLDLMGDTAVEHVQMAESDHCAPLIRMQRSGWLQGQRRERPFRYENMWQRHVTYATTDSAAWVPGSTSLEAVHANLKFMQGSLKTWERDHFGSVRNELSRLRRKLEETRAHTLYSGPSREERAIMAG